MRQTVAHTDSQEKTGFTLCGPLANSSSWNNCLFLLCLLLCNAGHCHLDKGDTHENSHNCTHTFARDSLSSLSVNVAFTVLFFWQNTCRYTSKLENSKPMKSFANWICKHVLLDSRGQEKMDWLPKGGGDAENSKPYFLCLDDSSGVGINTAWLAPGERGPLQEADISKLSIMDEKRSVRTANKRWRTNERIKYRAKGEG